MNAWTIEDERRQPGDLYQWGDEDRTTYAGPVFTSLPGGSPFVAGKPYRIWTLPLKGDRFNFDFQFSDAGAVLPIVTVDFDPDDVNAPVSGTTASQALATLQTATDAGNVTSHPIEVGGLSSPAWNYVDGAAYVFVEDPQRPGHQALQPLPGHEPLYTDVAGDDYEYVDASGLQPPNAPANFRVEYGDFGGGINARLLWEDKADNEANFVIVRGDHPDGPFVPVSTPPANATSQDLSLTNLGATQYYVLWAINAAGESAHVGPLTVRLDAPATLVFVATFSLHGTGPGVPKKLNLTSNSSYNRVPEGQNIGLHRPAGVSRRRPLA